MTVQDVKKRIKEIQSIAADYEAAHGEEDNLYIAVLQEIANGNPEAQQLAKEALKAQKLDFKRYTA